ncbi:MarR family winged helix-turn-helix transcriptional regulator [Spirochaeta isovalerica]|uniref:HTH-type transcriptional regulator SarZ n=1 Tax=Spirochaeta isovalerica TaxID=150 RepID=A0A841REA4_9SPIO|nr:MarR family transcriptional regulator [Spirochaeta isovalerica]MBB6480682.1 DNA-binding MarR family transcriptional regulator [Spirochaeta isovalerica]
MGGYEQLKLENQFCFPLYAASRLVTRMYQPLLEKLDITYPQYLILLVLWDRGEAGVMELGERLMLASNTLTPLLKRMESKGIIRRVRSENDERKVIISLTEKGKDMEEQACHIPEALATEAGENFPLERILKLRDELNDFLKEFKTI